MSNTNNITRVPRKWADVIKAWADGQAIQYRGVSGFPKLESPEWQDLDDEPSYFTPPFNEPEFEWRIKPAVKTGWIVIFSYTAGVQNLIDRIFDTKDQAQQYAELAFEKEWTVITVIQITYTEGEGLES